MHHPKFITVINSLDGTSEPVDKWSEPHGCLQTVVNSPAPGFIRNVMLGSAGLQVRHGEHWVVFPLQVLLAMAEKAQPAIKPPTPAEVQEAISANGRIVASALAK